VIRLLVLQHLQPRVFHGFTELALELAVNSLYSDAVIDTVIRLVLQETLSQEKTATMWALFLIGLALFLLDFKECQFFWPAYFLRVIDLFIQLRILTLVRLNFLIINGSLSKNGRNFLTCKCFTAFHTSF
jgi:hypothetical protein